MYGNIDRTRSTSWVRRSRPVYEGSKFQYKNHRYLSILRFNVELHGIHVFQPMDDLSIHHEDIPGATDLFSFSQCSGCHSHMNSMLSEVVHKRRRTKPTSEQKDLQCQKQAL